MWDWKANGYATASTPEVARHAAIEFAKADGCPESYRYLDAMKLACGKGCTSGEVARACQPKGEPSCEKGSFEKHRDMWRFVCRKAHGKAADTACTDAAAAAAPHFASCDVPLLATATLACSARCASP